MNVPVVRLGEVADVNWGDTNVTKSSYVQQGYIAYSATGADGFLPYADYDRQAIVLSAIGARCGKVWFADGKWSCIKNTIRYWSTDDRLDNRYLYWITNKEDFFPKRGAAQPFITIGDARATEIPLPPLDRQRKIAAILDKADDLCRMRKRMVDLLGGVTQSIFLEVFGDPVSNPMNWPTAAIGSITSKIGSGATPSGGDMAYKASGISLVRSMNVRDEGFTPKGLAYIDELQAAKLANVTLEVGDVLLNITGASVARVCLCPPEVLPGRVNQHVAIIRPTDKSLNAFIAAALKTPAMKAKLLGVAEAGATRQAITKSQIEQIVIPLPSKKALGRFRDANHNYHELSKKAQLQSLLMNSLFSSLQHRAFSGELQ